MNSQDLFALGVLDLACLLAAGMMFRAWRRRRTRQPAVAGASILVLAVVSSVLVLTGIPYRIVVGPAFILALFVVMYSARHERQAAAAPPPTKKPGGLS
jgi:peptidoglycan/LPS O-acetylase OafA/YrhL